MNEKHMNSNSDYWNEYYNKKDVPLLPSQFAVFVLGDKPDADVIIDIGCGNGRDSFFFAERGIPCLGIDGCKIAINKNIDKVKSRDIKNLTFLNADISDEKLSDRAFNFLLEHKNCKNILIYSRFFIHAINDEEEAALVSIIAKVLKEKSGTVALEFRTQRDQFQVKITSEHYRRYIDPVGFFSRIEKLGFTVEYFVEGFGMAKYKTDDAHVARFFLEKKHLEEETSK